MQSRIAAEAFTLDHFQDWSSRLVLDTGENWRLEQFQIDFVSDVFSGSRENWLILPEGNGKTTLIAGLALYGLRFSEDAMIPVAASTRDQARIMYRQAKGFLRRSDLNDPPTWFEAFDGYRRIDLRGPGATKRGEILGSIEIHAADAGTGDGIIPHPFCFLDELHRHKDLDLYETWRGKLDKRASTLVAISTAGEPAQAFEATRQKIRQETPIIDFASGFVRCRSDSVAFHEFALEAEANPLDMEAVKRCNPLPSITVETLSAKRSSPTMSAAHWARFVLNRPTRQVSAAIAESEWLNATSDVEIPSDADVMLGLDVGWVWDTTAIVPLWWKDDDFRLFGPASILVPPGDGSQLDPTEVKNAIRDLCGRYRVSTMVMDSSRAEDIAGWAADELGLQIVYRSQTMKPQGEDYDRFMEALREGWLFHSGDEGLRRHAYNAIARLLDGGGARFGRTSEVRNSGNNQARVIDALVAAAMVHSFAVETRMTSDVWVI
jgi:phage terminase large subunit-like protein